MVNKLTKLASKITSNASYSSQSAADGGGLGRMGWLANALLAAKLLHPWPEAMGVEI